jgi:hypothetical protein
MGSPPALHDTERQLAVAMATYAVARRMISSIWTYLTSKLFATDYVEPGHLVHLHTPVRGLK